MEQDFQSALGKFWQTVRQLRREKWNPVQTLFSVGRELLTSTEFIAQWWKEYFKEPLNPTNRNSEEEEAEPEDFWLGSPITGAEVAGAVR